MKAENNQTNPAANITNHIPCPPGGKGLGKGLHLTIYRNHLAEGFTLGKMWIQEGDEKPYFFCDTLEPQVREKKIWGKTAIPEGTYKIIIRHSPKFNKKMPYLVDVPNFENVMVHTGNTKKHTQGCILVGELYSAYNGIIWHSRIVFDKLWDKILNCIKKNGNISITITHLSYEEYKRRELADKQAQDIEDNAIGI